MYVSSQLENIDRMRDNRQLHTAMLLVNTKLSYYMYSNLDLILHILLDLDLHMSVKITSHSASNLDLHLSIKIRVRWCRIDLWGYAGVKAEVRAWSTRTTRSCPSLVARWRSQPASPSSQMLASENTQSTSLKLLPNFSVFLVVQRWKIALETPTEANIMHTKHKYTFLHYSIF